MNLDKLLEKGEKCIHREPPVCTAACPVHLEVIEFLSEIEKGNFKGANVLMEKKIPFHKIIGLICDHPCESVCVRGQVGGAIKISDLEKAVLSLSEGSNRKVWKIPPKKGSVAVIGGGISGLTAAVDLDKKGYAVTIYEKNHRLGGDFWNHINHLLTEGVMNNELKAVEDGGIKLCMSQKLGVNELRKMQSDYDAVFLGTGLWEQELVVDTSTFQVENSNLFVGGWIATRKDSVILSASSGRRAAISIDRYIQKVSMKDSREREGVFTTPLKQSTRGLPPAFAVEKVGTVYDFCEAQKEATRCIKCRCKRCIDGCNHFRKFEISPDAYVRQINHNERIILGTHYANKMINSCTLCGLCKEMCFLDIDMKEVIQETRESMVARNKMPISAHDFALRDMAFSNSQAFAMIQEKPPENETMAEKNVLENREKYLFYPGCQLPASYPRYIDKIYDYLLESVEGDVGIYLGCCGAPADWAGRQALMEASIIEINKIWSESGKPVFILACSSCMRVFNKYLPHIQTLSLWKIYAEKGLPSTDIKGDWHMVAVQDACATRENIAIHQSIRIIAERLGYRIDEFEYTGINTKCCGYGGLVYYANRNQADSFVEERIQETPWNVLVYCAMCRDLFVAGGKQTYHILDLIYGDNSEEAGRKKMPTLSERHHNRRFVKQNLLKKRWMKDTIQDKGVKLDINIPEDISKAMEERYILIEDIEDVIRHSIAKKERFFDPLAGEYLAKLRKENVTYWVKYKVDEDVFSIRSVYSHRMEIVEE